MLTFQTVFQTNQGMKTPEFPKEIRRGSVSVTIYKTPSKATRFMFSPIIRMTAGSGNTTPIIKSC